MNGPEHYAEAERLVSCLVHPNAGDMSYGDHQLSLAAAQVHATLALAAVTASTTEFEDDSPPIAVHADPGWERVLGYETMRWPS